jgi:hypothetical protein
VDVKQEPKGMTFAQIFYARAWEFRKGLKHAREPEDFR